MLQEIQDGRKSNWVIQLALLFNAILTAIFAYNHLGGVFGRLTGRGNDDVMINIVAAVFTVLVFDGAFHAWASISGRDGLSLEQIATASTAKTASMAGSLAASLGQFVLGQTAVVLPTGVVFVISLIATAAVGIIALLHMYWWDKYKNESFDAVERGFQARQDATVQKNVQSQAEQEGRVAIEQQRNEHLIKMERIQAENQLTLERMTAEQELERELIMQEIEHEKQVAAQTRELLAQTVERDAAAIAAVKSERLRRKFIARQGISADEMTPPALFQSPRVTQKIAADGVAKPARVEPVSQADGTAPN